MQTSIEISGADEFGKSIDNLNADMTNVITEATFFAAELTVKRAKPTVPVLTGRASRSLQAFQQGMNAVAEGGSGVDYYAWLEFGGASGRQHANVRSSSPEGRYLMPGYRMVVANIERAMVDLIKKYVKQNNLGGN